jgi:uncharacterized membrane protein|tara:strand:- start:74 stop:454 length:381 start_codon:yes stop_codon:yes gene_type:complete
MIPVTFVLRLIIFILFASAGIGHFRTFDRFMSIMEGLPFAFLHPAAVWITGVFELSLGIMVMLKPSPNVYHCLACLVLLMTPANINMWYRNLEFNGTRMSGKGHSLRGVAQIVLLYTLWHLGAAAA